MELLIRVMLAHFLADFPFQNSRLIEKRVKGWWGNIIHGTIFLVTALVITAPWLNNVQILLWLLLIAVIHTVQDWAKTRLFIDGKYDTVWLFLADQAVHYLFYASALLIKESWLPRGPLSSQLTLTLIGMIAVTYTGSVFLYYLKKTFTDERVSFDQGWEGMLERLIIFFLIVSGKALWYLIPLVVLFKAFFYFRNSLHLWRHFAIIIRREKPLVIEDNIPLKADIGIDLIASPFWAIIIGLACNALIPLV